MNVSANLSGEFSARMEPENASAFLTFTPRVFVDILSNFIKVVIMRPHSEYEELRGNLLCNLITNVVLVELVRYNFFYEPCIFF